MARPIMRRNVQSYKRDIESLGRLRTAMLMDHTLDWTMVQKAVKDIDQLVRRLIELSESSVKKSA